MATHLGKDLRCVNEKQKQVERRRRDHQRLMTRVSPLSSRNYQLTLLGVEVDLDGGVTPGVKDLQKEKEINT